MPTTKRWHMPGWMKRFSPMISDSGGYPIEDLVNDQGSLVFITVRAQVGLLYRLAANGALDGAPTDANFSEDCH